MDKKIIYGLLSGESELPAESGYARVLAENMHAPVVFPDLVTPVVVTGWFAEQDTVRTVHVLDEPMGFIAGSTPFIFRGRLFRGLATEATIYINTDGGMAVGT